MKDGEKKIDKRKENLGRYGKKGKPTTTQTEIKVEGENLDQQNIINEMQTTGINPHENPMEKEIKPAEKVVEQTTTTNQTTSGGEDIIDPTKLSDKIENIGYTPTSDPVNEKDYSNPYKGQVTNPDQPIPEPVFQKPSIENIASAFGNDAVKPKTEGTSSSSSQESATQTNVLNPNTQRFADTAEKRQGAEQLVDGVLDIYGLLHQFGAWVASVNMDKLAIEEIEGKIDLGIQIPVTENQTLSLKDFLENYNREAKKMISVDDEFIAKVRPVMIRICEKKGWGLTDEEYVGYLFLRDIIEKTALIYGMKRGVNDSLKYIKAQYKIAQDTRGNISNQNNNNTQRQETTSNASTEQNTTQTNSGPLDEFVDKTSEEFKSDTRNIEVFTE